MSSIQEVAKQAGVAPSTVSLVANGKARVSDKTREHVQKVIEQLNWQPRSANSENNISSNYSSSIEKNKNARPHHIGVLYGCGMVLSEGLVDYCRKWIMGLRDSFAGGGAVISVYQGVDHIDNDLMFGRNLQKKDFDGVVLMGVNSKEGYLKAILNSGVRTVVMNQRSLHGEFSSVRADSWAAGRLAATHLQKLGHKKLAVLLSGGNPMEPSYDLLGGFFEALQGEEMELVYDRQGKPSAELYDPESLKKIARQMIDCGATACFTGDPVGLRISKAMDAIGIDVPDEFSILGWDDLDYKTDSGKKLSSIGYSKNMMGLMAGRMLQNLFDMNGDVTNLAATVPVRLNDGQTTAPASKEPRTQSRSDVVSGYNADTFKPSEYQKQYEQEFETKLEPELAGV